MRLLTYLTIDGFEFAVPSNPGDVSPVVAGVQLFGGGIVSAYLDYEGQPVPARDLSWYLVGPCGCSAGVTVAEMPMGGEIRATPEQAADAMHETAEHRKRAEAEGWTMQLGRRDECVERMRAECPHTPRWGVEPRVALDGYAWAIASGGKRDHLVDSDDLENVVVGKVAAICGSSAYHFAWSTEWLADLECSKCESKARAIVETQGTLATVYLGTEAVASGSGSDQ